MKISIITVCFNSSLTITDTMLSVLGQSYNDIEYIIIDGGSTDSTIEKIKLIEPQFVGRLKYYSGPDSGIYDAMNKGILLANGEVIGILNSDDVYNGSTVVEMIMREFIQNEQLNIVYGDLVYVRADNLNKVVRRWVSKPYNSRFFDNGDVPAHPTLFVRRQRYCEIGFFNLNYRFAADYDLMLRFLKKNNLSAKYIPVVIVKMRLGGVTNNSLFNIFRQNIEILNSWRSNGLNVPIQLLPMKFFKRLIQFIN